MLISAYVDTHCNRSLPFRQASQHHAELSATTTAPTAIQNPSLRELHVVKAG